MGRNHRQRRHGAGIAQHGGAIAAGQRRIVQRQRVVVNDPARPTHDPAVMQPDAARAFAHGQTPQYDHFQQQAPGVRRQIDLRVALQRAAVIKDGFLRQPVQPTAGRHVQAYLRPCRPGHGPIGAFSGLGGGQRLRIRAQIDVEFQPVIGCQPARGVQKHDLRLTHGHARQHRLGRAGLRQIDQTLRSHDDMGAATAALHDRGVGQGIKHVPKGRGGAGKVNRGGAR